MNTFAALRDCDLRTRCRVCGAPSDDESVTVKIDAARTRNRPNTEWLYRKSVTMCEACAVSVVEAALAAMGAGR